MKTKKIPFDLKRWESGDFLRIENGIGEQVEQIFYFDKLKDENYPIYAVIDNEMWTFTEKGIFNLNFEKIVHKSNLYLIIEAKEYEDRFVNLYENVHGDLHFGSLHTTEKESIANIKPFTSLTGSTYIKTINLKDLVV